MTDITVVSADGEDKPYYRQAIAVLDEFRSGKIGKITLETPQKPPLQEKP